MIVIEILGDPITKLRPRFARRKGFACVYDCQAKEKELSRFNLQHQCMEINHKLSNLPLNCAFGVDLTFYSKTPNSLSRHQKNAKLWDYDKCTHKPDLDNLIKWILDIGNGILWPDDNAIVTINAKKIYSVSPKTIIKILTYTIPKMSLHMKKFIKNWDPLEFREFIIDIQQLGKVNPNLLDEYRQFGEVEVKDSYFNMVSEMMSDFSKKYHNKLSKTANGIK